MVSAAASPEAIRAEVAELLGVSAETIDPHNNLIGQGLDSIRMMALAGRWRRQGVAIDFAALATTPTVEAWSALLSAAVPAAEPPAPEANTDTAEAFPLAPMQHALWVGRQDNQQLGGVAAHLYVEFDAGALDPERLRSAATGLALRHPMLRVRFLPDGIQRIDPAGQIAVGMHDLRDLTPEAVEQRLSVIRDTKSHQQLDGVLELTLSLLPGQRSRLHVDLDMQAADAMSYRTLMADLAPGPSALPAAQRAVRDAINTRTAVASGEALHDGFFRRADATPEAPAVYASSGDLSYRQLRDQALAVAAALRNAGVAASDSVAVMGPKCAEQIPAVLGILAAGGTYLPVGVDHPADRVERILGTGAVSAALVCGDQAVSLPVPSLTVAEALRRGARCDIPPSTTDPAELAYVLFTSGSTGEPKGVEMTHDAAMNTVEFLTCHFGIGADDRCLALSTLECDMSVLDIFATLRSGGAIVVVDEAQRRDPDAWARLIDAHRVTVLNFLPGWLEMLLEVGAGRLSSLRVVPTGGDWVRPELARRLGAQAPNLRFAGLGGATETAVHATICEIRDASDPPAGWTAVPYGTPFPNIACRVVNDGDDCPDWVAGELWVSGRGVARGYRGRPEETADRFVVHDGRVWYRTGDLARYWPDGTLEFVGRADQRVKISGYRVDLSEVEAALRRVPGVVTAVAAMVPTLGGVDILTAAVQVDNAQLTDGGITEAMTEIAPGYMVPRHLAVVDRIPFTDGGKIDRRAVTDRLAATTNDFDIHRSTPLQSALALIVGDVLGVDTVNADDDFFALGGDSVLATAAVARIRAWLDTPDVMVPDMFAARTISALAALLAGRQADGGRRLEQVAELYLEVVCMNADDVLSENAKSGMV